MKRNILGSLGSTVRPRKNLPSTRYSIRFVIYTIFVLANFTQALASDKGVVAATESLLIRGGWLFDGISENRRRNSGILIHDGKIVDVDFLSNEQSSTLALIF